LTSKQPFDLGQAAQQGPYPDVVADLSGGDKQVEWPPLTVADGVQLGVHAALGLTD